MTKLKIYAGGSIGGHSYEIAMGWRERMQNYMGDDVTIINPLRDSPRMESQTIVPMADSCHLTNPHSLLQRCLWDVQQCDVMLGNLAYARHPSQGTCSEMAWAYAFRKPIVYISPTPGNWVFNPEYPFFRAWAAYVIEPKLLADEDVLHAADEALRDACFLIRKIYCL
jgi:hypothetical protein